MDRGLNRTGELMERAQNRGKGGDVALERMQRNYSRLQKEKEALEESLEVSRSWTWIWFIAFAALLVVELVRLGRWIGA